MNATAAPVGFTFYSNAPTHMHRHFMPHVLHYAGDVVGRRVLDVGCGNGATCGEFLKRGAQVVGVDVSAQAVSLATSTHPSGHFEVVESGSDFLRILNEEPFDIIVSTEVVEHLYSPASWASGCFQALRNGGTFICTAPYHGYWKNLTLSLLGLWPRHMNPLEEGGHIKMWQPDSMQELLRESGFDQFEYTGAGRCWPLWMTMVCRVVKPVRSGT